MVENFIPLRGGADGPAGLLLAINPANVSHITSYFDKRAHQSMLRLHLNNARIIGVYEHDAEAVLQALGLDEYAGDWVLNLEKDVG